jgi:hypothetical protein
MQLIVQQTKVTKIIILVEKNSWLMKNTKNCLLLRMKVRKTFETDRQFITSLTSNLLWCLMLVVDITKGGWYG